MRKNVVPDGMTLECIYEQDVKHKRIYKMYTEKTTRLIMPIKTDKVVCSLGRNIIFNTLPLCTIHNKSIE